MRKSNTFRLWKSGKEICVQIFKCENIQIYHIKTELTKKRMSKRRKKTVLCLNVLKLFYWKIGKFSFWFDSFEREKMYFLFFQIERVLKGFALSKSQAYYYMIIICYVFFILCFIFKCFRLIELYRKNAKLDLLGSMKCKLVWRNIYHYSYDETSDSDRRRLLSCFQNRRSSVLS